MLRSSFAIPSGKLHVNPWSKFAKLSCTSFSPRAESLPIVHTLMSTSVPLGMSYPATVASWRATRGMRRGTIGCMRIVSLTIALR
nr:unnamed protein product [Digitaria exilis]